MTTTTWTNGGIVIVMKIRIDEIMIITDDIPTTSMMIVPINVLVTKKSPSAVMIKTIDIAIVVDQGRKEVEAEAEAQISIVSMTTKRRLITNVIGEEDVNDPFRTKMMILCRIRFHNQMIRVTIVVVVINDIVVIIKIREIGNVVYIERKTRVIVIIIDPTLVIEAIVVRVKVIVEVKAELRNTINSLGVDESRTEAMFAFIIRRKDANTTSIRQWK